MKQGLKYFSKIIFITFLLQKRIEAKIHENHPDKWVPLYTQVSFSNIRYSEAYKNGKGKKKSCKK